MLADSSIFGKQFHTGHQGGDVGKSGRKGAGLRLTQFEMSGNALVDI